MSAVTKLMTPGGGGVSLTPASSIAADVTVNVPSQNCTLGIQGPAFSAYQSIAQTPAALTNTKVQFQSENFDTANCFDRTTNYRFTPNVAGYYQVNSVVRFPASTTRILMYLFKNGASALVLTDVSSCSSSGGSCLIYMNGTTDYLEVYVLTGTSTAMAADNSTSFSASLVRAA